MEFTPIIAQVWGTLDWVIPLMLLIGLLKSPWAKGHIGEFLVRLFAHRQLDKHTYRRLHNVTLNTPDDTTQTDRVFRAPYGYIQSFQQPIFSAAEIDAMLHALQTGRCAPTIAPIASMCKTSNAAVIQQPRDKARNATAPC